MKPRKKMIRPVNIILLVSAGIFLSSCTTEGVLHRSGDFFKEIYCSYRIEKEYRKSIAYCEKSVEKSSQQSVQESLSSLNRCQLRLSENLAFFKKHRKYISTDGPGPRESDILFDIGITDAFIALQYKKRGDMAGYNQQMQTALAKVSSVAPAFKTENDVQRFIENTAENAKDKQVEKTN